MACACGIIDYPGSWAKPKSPNKKADGSSGWRGLSRWDLLLVDDWGFTTLTLAESQDLFEIVDDRYQARGLAIASQVPIDQWHALFPDPTLAEAILDRLIHGAHRVVIQGESMRKVLSSPTEQDTTNITE